VKTQGFLQISRLPRCIRRIEWTRASGRSAQILLQVQALAAETGADACNRADCFTPKKRRESKAIFCRLPTYALPKI